MNDLEFWTTKLKEAERELEAAEIVRVTALCALPAAGDYGTMEGRPKHLLKHH